MGIQCLHKVKTLRNSILNLQYLILTNNPEVTPEGFLNADFISNFFLNNQSFIFNHSSRILERKNKYRIKNMHLRVP